jgi:hypothetical protein
MGSGLGGVPTVGGDPQVGICAGEDHRRLRTILEKRKEKRGPRLKIGGTTIRTEESMKYLGVIIDRGLSWREHARYAARNIMTTAH